jgi:hypothetical protein
MDPANLRAYVQRDWQRLQDHEARAWLHIKATHGVTAAILAAESLRLAARELDPGWPSEADRQADLETHIRVSRMLRSVSLQ